MRHRPRLALATAALALCAVALIAGCSAKPVATKSAADPLSGVTAAPLSVMTAAEKRSLIATSFPLEVPIPKGEVTRHDAQGDTAWDYGLVLPDSTLAVERWYLEEFAGAEWEVISRTTSTLTLHKGIAEIRLQFAKGPKPDTTAVSASVGVGTSVLQTQ